MGGRELKLVDTQAWVWWMVGDPRLTPAAGEALNVATAIEQGVPLVTSDREIRAFPGVETIW